MHASNQFQFFSHEELFRGLQLAAAGMQCKVYNVQSFVTEMLWHTAFWAFSDSDILTMSTLIISPPWMYHHLKGCLSHKAKLSSFPHPISNLFTPLQDWSNKRLSSLTGKEIRANYAAYDVSDGQMMLCKARLHPICTSGSHRPAAAMKHRPPLPLSNDHVIRISVRMPGCNRRRPNDFAHLIASVLLAPGAVVPKQPGIRG